jgi:hypothetical protein
MWFIYRNRVYIKNSTKSGVIPKSELISSC